MNSSLRPSTSRRTQSSQTQTNQGERDGFSDLTGAALAEADVVDPDNVIDGVDRKTRDTTPHEIREAEKLNAKRRAGNRHRFGCAVKESDGFSKKLNAGNVGAEGAY